MSGREIVVGNSLVRGNDGRFCGSSRGSRIVCCLLCVRVQDVSEQLNNILERWGAGGQNPMWNRGR